METAEIGENLPPSISLSHSSTHSFIYSLFLSFCLSPSITHKLILSLPWKTAQQHEIVYYSITLVPFFFFHFSLCMPYKEEKMLLYALTPSTIFRKKNTYKKRLKVVNEKSFISIQLCSLVEYTLYQMCRVDNIVLRPLTSHT